MQIGASNHPITTRTACAALVLFLLPVLLPTALGAGDGGSTAGDSRVGLGDPPSGDIRDFWRELRAWTPEVGRSGRVVDVVLVRDAAEFHLDDGVLTLLDLEGRTVGAVFEGEGRVRIAPPLKVERDNLLRELEWQGLEAPFESVFFLFADTTAQELEARLSLSPGPTSNRVRDEVRSGVDYFAGKDEGDLSWTAVRTFKNDEPTQLFHAHIDAREGDDLYFRFDALEEEAVEFGRASRGSLEVVTSFHRRSAYDPSGAVVAPGPPVHPVDALHYEADLRIDGYDMAGEVSITLVPTVEGGSWVAATLFHELEVGSVRWGDGSPVTYDRFEDELAALWIQLPEGTAPGSPLTLRASYRGKILERSPEGFHYLRSTSGWLPRFPGSEPTFDLTFRARKDWPVMSIGTRVSREVDPSDDDRVVSRWVTTRPSAHVTFSVGDFEEYEFPAGKAPPIRIHVAEEFHRRFRDLTSQAATATGGAVNILSQNAPEEKVHLDVENSLAFFSRVFGPLDREEYNVAEIPFSHGQAFPGMINLSWVTFQWTQQNGLDELFRAHEVAHQWWGIAVRPATYHDAWLAEGLSEFSALWYMHRIRANPARYFQRLEDLRKEVVEGADDRGPIWLGRRLATGEDGVEDYTVTVYSKGAWVMHMLRNIMVDHDTGSEEVFERFIRALFTRFRGRSIATEEFQAFLEAYVQVDLQWFFDQWVYGTDVPTYRFAYTTEKVDGGQVRMTIRVRQEDVPEDFRMPVPLLLDFGAEGRAVVPVVVTGRELVTELPLLPREPDAVVFNASESVLAEVRTEGW